MAKRESAATLAAQDRLDAAVLFEAVSATFPGATFLESFERDNAKDIRCAGQASAHRGIVPCGNSPEHPGSLCAGCRAEGRGE